jgi:thiol-disulfide isomerase/thioredoxin
MKRRRILLGLVLATALLGSACSGGTDAVDQSAGGQYRYVGATPKGKAIAEAKRKPAGPAAGTLLGGGGWTLNSLKGQVVVLNYWATWCAPCRIETPNLQKVYTAWKPKGVTLVGIDVKEANRSPVQAFVKDNAVTYPIVFDEGAKTALQIGHLPLQGLPNTVVIDKQGRVAAVYVGNVLPADLEPVLASLTTER